MPDRPNIEDIVFEKKDDIVWEKPLGQPTAQSAVARPPDIPGPPEAEAEGRFPTGAVVGGTVLGAVGQRFGGTPGGIAGSTIGSAIGELGEQVVRGEDIDIGRATKEGALGFTGEVASRGAFGLGGMLFRAIKPRPRISPEAQKAIEFLDKNMPTSSRGRLGRFFLGDPKKITLLPAEATEGIGMDVLHNVAENSMIGSQRIRDFKLNRTKLFKDMADDIVDSFGSRVEPELLGTIFEQTITNNIKPSRLLSTQLYNSVDDIVKPTIVKSQVDELVPTGLFDDAGKPIMRTVKKTVEREFGGARISLKEVKKFAKPLKQLAKELGGIEGKNAGDDIISSMLGMNDTISYEVANELRSRLLGIVDEFSVINPKAKAIGRAKRLISLVHEATENGLKDFDKINKTNSLEVWTAARRIYRQGSEQFDNRFIRSLLRKGDSTQGGDPEAIVGAIFKPGRPTRIRRIKKAMLAKTNPRSWERMQSYVLEDLFKKATKKGTAEIGEEAGIQTGEIIGANLLESMYGRTGLGEKMMREIFSPAQLKNITEFANALKVAQARQGSGLGRMAIQLSQVSGVVSLTYGAVSGDPSAVGTGSILVLGPAVLARAMTNPRIGNALIHGLRVGGKSKVTAGALGRFITDVTNMQFAEQSEVNQ